MTDNRFALVATLTAKPGEEDAVGNALNEMVSKMADEPDTLVYCLNRYADDPAKFVLYEIFVDEETWRRHADTEAIEWLRVQLKDRTIDTEIVRLQPINAKGLA